MCGPDSTSFSATALDSMAQGRVLAQRGFESASAFYQRQWDAIEAESTWNMCDDQLNKIENVIKVTSRNFSLSQKISTCDLYFLSSRGSHFPSVCVFFFFFTKLLYFPRSRRSFVFPISRRSYCISPVYNEAVTFPKFTTKLLYFPSLWQSCCFPSSWRCCCISPLYDETCISPVRYEADVSQVCNEAVVFPQFITKLSSFLCFWRNYFPSSRRSYWISPVYDEAISPVNDELIECPQFMTKLFPQFMKRLLCLRSS